MVCEANAPTLRKMLLLAGALWITFVYVRHDQLGWNAASRLCLTYALVDQGSLRIDDYWRQPELQTRDVAAFGGHYYCDKIIGTSLLGVPALAAIRLFEHARGFPLSPQHRHWLVIAFSVALVGAAAGALFFRLTRCYLQELGHSPPVAEALAGLATLFTFVGTMLVLYGGVFFPYLPAIFFLLLALWLIEEGDGWRKDFRGTTVWAFLVGVALGAATLCDYLAAWPALYLAILALSRRPYPVAFLTLPLGAIVSLSPFLLYCYHIFGRFSVPYEYELDEFFRASMGRGFMGATWPNPTVAYLLAFHPYRGIFYHSPQLLLSIVGGVIGWHYGAKWQMRLVVFFSAFVGLFIYVSAYYMWWGGWTLAPRLLAVVVPFLAFAVLPALHLRWMQIVGLILGSWALFLHLIMLFMPADFPERPGGAPPESLLYPDLSRYDYPAIFARYVWPKFLLGETDPSLSDGLGLSGAAKVLPLAILWLIVAVIFLAPVLRPGQPTTKATWEE